MREKKGRKKEVKAAEKKKEKNRRATGPDYIESSWANQTNTPENFETI